jgi:hypothetical protein
VARTPKLTKKDRHVQRFHSRARSRAKEKDIPFDISLEYLRSIATDSCPVFHTPFGWGPSGLGRGKFKDNAPQLDRIIPELGYIVGNVAFISHRANRIKDNGTMQEHYDIADWIWDRTVSKTKKKSAPSLSKRDHIALDVDHEYGSLPRARPWEDNNSTDNSARVKISRDLGDRPIKDRTERVESGVSEMGTFKILESLQNFGIALTAATSTGDARRHLLGELRERGLAGGELDTE